MQPDHYTILGIPYQASSEQIRNAYFSLARKFHPDVNSNPEIREQFLQIQIAYETLSNSQRRLEYDSSLPPEFRTGPAVSLNIRYSQPAVQPLHEAQLMYALVDLLPTAEVDTSTLPPCHICLVLDKSTSMDGARMDMVKAGAFHLLQQLRSNDVVSVVAFSDRAEVVIPPTRGSQVNRSDARISFLRCKGGTEIYQGLQLGVEQLRKTRPVLVRQLILLTDGQTYGDDADCLALAAEAREEGITISVLGIGNEWNDQLMDQVAARNGGYSNFLAQASDLDQFLQQKLGEVNDLYARNLRFEFECPEGAQLRYAFRLSPNTGPLELATPIHFGDLPYKKSMAFLLEFLLPPLTLKEEGDEFVMARGEIWMELAARRTNVRLMADLRLPVHVGVVSEPPPAVIVEAMSKLTLYRMQERARSEVNAGQYQQATQHLRAVATHLLSRGDHQLARTVIAEAEFIEKNHQFRNDGEKRIKYGTRSLLLPAGPE